MKTFLAAIVAAIAVQPLVLFGWLFLPALLDGRGGRLEDLGPWALLAVIIATPVVLLVGVPAALLLRRARRRALWLGVVGFVVMALPFAGLPDLQQFEPGDLVPALVAGLHGLAGALAFHSVLQREERRAVPSGRPRPRSVVPSPESSSSRSG